MKMTDETDTDPDTCGWCGTTPAAGFAEIDGVRYCHGPDDLSGIEPALAAITDGLMEPTCYEEATDYMMGHQDYWPLWEDVTVNARYL